MNIDDARTWWRSPQNEEAPPLSDVALLALVKAEAKRFDRRIALRDLREIAAAAIAAVLIAPTAVHANLLTRLGVLVMVAALVLVVVTLLRARRVARAPHMEQPVAFALRADRANIDAQIRLLKSVLWWYVGPIWAGLVMIFVGRAGLSWLTLGCVLAITLLSILVYRLNVFAADSYLLPRRTELSRLLAVIDASDETGA